MYGTEFIKIIHVIKTKKYQLNAIRNYYKINFEEKPLIIYWHSEKFFYSKRHVAFNEIKYNDDIKKCTDILELKSYKNESEETEYDYFNILYNTFNPTQLFFDNSPFSTLTDIKIDSNILSNKNQDNSLCIICSDNFKEGDDAQQLDKCKVYIFYY
uniref:BAH domain-containing protein n=1 Tax=Meloidogyne hapla TaxID=6305 RepID=A0A1I8C2J9_MELHA